LNSTQGQEIASQKFNDSLQILGMFGIIGSLAFVGLQLKQSQEIAIASQYQARLDSVIAVKGNLLQSDSLIEVTRKAENGEPLGQTDILVLDLAVGQIFDLWETNHFQYVNGFVSEEHWQGVLREIDMSLGKLYVPEYWASNRLSYRESFVEIIDSRFEAQRNENNAQ
jgi:hypothetical protein